MTRSIGIGSLCIRSFVSKGIITSKGNITLTRSIGIGSLRRQPLIRKGNLRWWLVCAQDEN